MYSSNIFYFPNLNELGGTEQYLYEIAKMYGKYDITLYYDTANEFQLKRLRKLIRCKKREKGQLVKCRKAFFNYNIDMIEDVEAEEYIFVAHGIFQELKSKPPIDHPKLNRFIGVSKYACDMLEKYAKSIGRNDIKVELFYNPLIIEPKEKVVRIVIASRLADNVKGGDRTKIFIDALDRYCIKKGRHYILEMFSDSQMEINSKNVVKMRPRVDVRPYIADADILAQFSNNMETFCYSINEALSYGLKIVTTPLTVLEELNIPEEARLTCNWNMSNVDEIVRRIFEDEFKEFTYIPPKAEYENILDLTPSNYKEELSMKYKVKALDTYKKHNVTDNELGYVPEEGTKFIVSQERLDVLLGANAKGRVYVEVVEEIKEVEPAEEITEEIVQAVAKGIVAEAEEQDKPVETIVEEIIEESKEEPKVKKKTSKKGGKTNDKCDQGEA